MPSKSLRLDNIEEEETQTEFKILVDEDKKQKIVKQTKQPKPEQPEQEDDVPELPQKFKLKYITFKMPRFSLGKARTWLKNHQQVPLKNVRSTEDTLSYIISAPEAGDEKFDLSISNDIIYTFA